RQKCYFFRTDGWVLGGGAAPPTTSTSILRNSFGLRKSYNYLICSFGATTATGLAKLLKGDINHDEVTQWLVHKERTSAEFWVKVKPYVRKIGTGHSKRDQRITFFLIGLKWAFQKLTIIN
ncbi:MAG: hypothetical protein ACK47G_15500, partial [Pseudanabaena sp.]